MEKALELAIDKLDWKREALELQYQESGLTNRNFIVSNGREKAVVRVNGEHGEALGIDRRAEKAALEAVSSIGTAPELLYFDPGQGCMITRFIEGRTWTADDLAANAERIGAFMRKVHAAGEIDFEFSPYASIERWLQRSESGGRKLPGSMDRRLERLRRIQADREKVADKFRGLCHNDPFANNFIDDGSVRLLDWEFAGMGDIMYDLACIGQSMGTEAQTSLLRAYFGETSPELLQALRDMDYVVAFWNAMWAVTMTNAASHPGFDYAGLTDFLFRRMDDMPDRL